MVRGSPAIASLEPYIWVLFGLSAAPSVALWGGARPALGHPPAFAVAAFVEAAGVAGERAVAADPGDGDRRLGASSAAPSWA